MTEKKNIICRCEEIEIDEIREWIARGYDTFDELKGTPRRYERPAREGAAAT